MRVSNYGYFKMKTLKTQHKAQIVKDYLTQRGIVVLEHFLNLSDLAPCNFWLFHKFKFFMKDHCFSSINDIQKPVTEALNNLSKNDFSLCFDSFYNCFQKCIDAQGDYFK